MSVGGERMQGFVRLYEQGDVEGALRLAKALRDQANPSSPNNHNCAAILIDCGNLLNDVPAIKDGISIFRAIADSKSEDERGSVFYNISNGYGALAFCCERQGDLDGRLVAWRQQRDILQEVLLTPEGIDSELLPNVLTNYANVLDELGRSSEAIYYYQRALDLRPDHPIALGNQGQVLMRLLGIQPQHNIRLLFRAHGLLTSALKRQKDLREIAGPEIEDKYRVSLQQVEEYGAQGWGSLDEFLRRAEGLREMHPDLKISEDTLQCASQGLLLTINPYPEWCPSTLKDDLFFTALGRSDVERFTRLAHTLNQIKEEYALARYLLLRSEEIDVLKPLSELTQYADTLDYADFGLSSGLLKASIKHSVDIFDKVANFLNRYLVLGIADKSVNFSSVWYERGLTDPSSKKRREHPKLKPHVGHSGWLKGIRDVAATVNAFPAPMRDIRNKATHDFLIVENAVRPRVIFDGKPVSADAQQLARQLLVMAHGVVVNLVAFVQRLEHESRKEDGNSASIDFRYSAGLSDELAGG